MIFKHIQIQSGILTTLAALTIQAYLSPMASFADDGLDRVLRSKDLKVTAADKLRWLSEDTNYSKVFSKNGEGVKNLITWIGTVSDEFRPQGAETALQQDIAIARRVYIIRENFHPITTTIVVPSRPLLMSAQYKLIRQINKFSPPMLEVKAEEVVEIGGNHAKLYTHKSGRECSLVVDIARYGVLNLHTDSCEDRDYLIALAKKLNIDRLCAKLSQENSPEE